MFRSAATTPEEYVTVEIDGVTALVPAGISVATALLLQDMSPYRQSPVNGEARGPYCMIGHCFDCLVEIDGEPNQQGCLIEVRENMKIRRQLGRPCVTTGRADND